MDLYQLSPIQQNVLIASIMGDGEITKIYKNSRRKNNSYREHYGQAQEKYREWKQLFLPDLLYFNKKSHSFCSRSLPLFTQLYPHFYNSKNQKQVPKKLLPTCTLPHFLAVLYMDDGTLSITKRINHTKKRIYLTPSIMLALQCFPVRELNLLQKHIHNTFNYSFKLCSTPSGYGYMLRFTSVQHTFSFLHYISPVTNTCPSMFYKTNWDWRYNEEKQLLLEQYPNYEIIASSSDRCRSYSSEEINCILILHKKGESISNIARAINRTYWSVVYKLRELKEKNLL
ncbi:DNA endonuclease [Priestia aryabhattai]|uniref:DNA endonuclease n=1 Tax=Priestia aryabhattai TaxID=412384 RepID=UPI001FB35B08|nr:DNA endonuclease [Priestia aryabhattai]